MRRRLLLGARPNVKRQRYIEAPLGAVYNCPIRKWHDAKTNLTAFEASPDVAVQVYNRAIHNQLMARIKGGQSIKQVIAWAKDELDGFARRQFQAKLLTAGVAHRNASR